MSLIEGWRRRHEEFQRELGSLTFAFLIAESLKSKKKIQAEKVFAQRIQVAIKKEEIQFTSNFPSNEPEGPIAIRFAQFKDFEDRGYAIFLVVKEEWIKNALESKRKDRTENLEFLYENLKTTLQAIDELRAKDNHVLSKAECEEIVQKQRLMGL